MVLVIGCLPPTREPFRPPTAFPEDVVPPISDVEYYSNSSLVAQAEINKIIDNTVTRLWIKLSWVETIGEEKRERVRWTSGIGIFDGNHIRTVAHLFKEDKEVKEIYFIDRKMGKTDVEIIELNRKKDTALLKMPDGFNYPLPVEIGDSSKIAHGDWLFIVTEIRFSIILKDGIVSTPWLDIREIKKTELDPENIFWITVTGIGPGDSGAAVFAVREGKLELVGMISGTLTRKGTRDVILVWVVKI